MGYIYKITNLQNNKIYIGKTTTCIQERFSKHIYEANTPNTKGYMFILHTAFRKYGINNFNIEQIEEIDNSLLNDREIVELIYEQLHKGNKNKVADIEQKGGFELYVTDKTRKKD